MIFRRDAIEPGEPESSAKQVNKGENPANAVEVGQDDLVNEQGRSEAEGDDVGQGIKFPTEGAFMSAQARQSPIKQIENTGSEHESNRLVILGHGHVSLCGNQSGLDDCHHGGESAEKIPGGHQIRQKIDFWFHEDKAG